MGPVVIPHQQADALGSGLIEPQAAADLLSHLRAGAVVAVKVSHALLVQREALGLAQIVQQHSPPQHWVRRGGGHRVGRMAPHVVAVMAVVLVEAHAGQDLRQYHPQHLRILFQHPSRVLSAQQLGQLLLDTLRRHVP